MRRHLLIVMSKGVDAFRLYWKTKIVLSRSDIGKSAWWASLLNRSSDDCCVLYGRRRIPRAVLPTLCGVLAKDDAEIGRAMFDFAVTQFH